MEKRRGGEGGRERGRDTHLHAAGRSHSWLVPFVDLSSLIIVEVSLLLSTKCEEGRREVREEYEGRVGEETRRARGG